MSRDDTALYTGKTSSSFIPPAQVELNKKREEAAIERDVERKAMAPYARIISDAFNKEIDDLSKVDYLNLDESLSDKEFKEAMLLNKKTIESVMRVKRSIENKMRMH